MNFHNKFALPKTDEITLGGDRIAG